MARRAASEAMARASWSNDDEFAIIIGTSKGSVETWLTPLQHMLNEACEAGGFDGIFPITGLADIAAALPGRGPKWTVSAACASGLLALIRGAMLIRSGEARRVLVVAAEASVHPLFLGSFNRLGVLPAPEIGCRPFDLTRDGFLMSEAAAAVCLEAGHVSPPQSEAPDNDPPMHVAIDRFALGADATHLTAGDPTGRVLTHLISKVIGDHDAVDLIHAHGTGTLANDPVELAAIETALADKRPSPSSPCLYSHKGALGHSLGAAGLVAVVLNVLAHQRGVIPPNVRTPRPLPARYVEIASIARQRAVRRSIALAAGFGGAIAAVSLKTV
ncbi:MAG TPA: beta-ketoacyl synthase N-terminal-like domain-containing protein [Tepidisphaeraceae bacterium]